RPSPRRDQLEPAVPDLAHRVHELVDALLALLLVGGVRVGVLLLVLDQRERRDAPLLELLEQLLLRVTRREDLRGGDLLRRRVATSAERLAERGLRRIAER